MAGKLEIRGGGGGRGGGVGGRRVGGLGKCNVLEDVGIVKAVLSWLRRMMKEGLMDGTVMDPFSWRLNLQAQAEQRRELASESSWFPPVMQAEILKSQDPVTFYRVNVLGH
jgi:hypothetical protein